MRKNVKETHKILLQNEEHLHHHGRWLRLIVALTAGKSPALEYSNENAGTRGKEYAALMHEHFMKRVGGVGNVDPSHRAHRMTAGPLR